LASAAADVRFDVASFAVVIGRARNGPRMNGDQQQASGTALLAIVNRRAVLGAGTRPSRRPGTNRMRNNILGLAAAMALCTTTINTGGTAAYGRGSHSVVIFAATSATGPGATRPDRRAAESVAVRSWLCVSRLGTKRRYGGNDYCRFRKQSRPREQPRPVATALRGTGEAQLCRPLQIRLRTGLQQLLLASRAEVLSVLQLVLTRHRSGLFD
jgi:hypothetical protein